MRRCQAGVQFSEEVTTLRQKKNAMTLYEIPGSKAQTLKPGKMPGLMSCKFWINIAMVARVLPQRKIS